MADEHKKLAGEAQAFAEKIRNASDAATERAHNEAVRIQNEVKAAFPGDPVWRYQTELLGNIAPGKDPASLAALSRRLHDLGKGLWELAAELCWGNETLLIFKKQRPGKVVTAWVCQACQSPLYEGGPGVKG